MNNPLIFAVALLSVGSVSQAADNHSGFPPVVHLKNAWDVSDSPIQDFNPHQPKNFRTLMQTDKSYQMLLSLSQAVPKVYQVATDVFRMYQQHETQVLLSQLIEQQKKTNQMLERVIKEGKHA